MAQMPKNDRAGPINPHNGKKKAFLVIVQWGAARQGTYVTY